MSKQDIEKRLGFAAQGVKETTRTSAKAKFVRFMDLETWKNSKGTVFTAGIEDDAGRFQPYVTARDSSGGDQLQTRSAPTFKTEQGARKWLNTWMQNNKSTSSRPGAKAEMGFLSRVGYAATALTADPADPKSPEYRKQVSEAKAAAKDAITNYKFMRDKVKERLAALDAYVTNAIKVINSATSAKDIEHYVEQLRIAVKSQSMILGASKSPFSRAGAKAKFADAALDQIRNNAAISDKILTLVSKGLSVPQAIDSVLGEGTYKRIGSEVYDELKKAKSSRPGTKAKMSATFIVAEAIFNAENAVRRGDNENARRWIKAAQDAMDETVVSTGMRSKLEQLVKRYKMSRPGVKAKFATEVGRKGNKSAMISRDATGTWYAYVVQRIETGIGKDEDMLGTMRAYSTEDRAKRAAIKALDTSGFSRPGVKAKA